MLVPLVAYYLVFYNGDNHSISERRGLTAFWYSTTRSFPLQIWYSFTRSFPLQIEIQPFYKKDLLIFLKTEIFNTSKVVFHFYLGFSIVCAVSDFLNAVFGRLYLQNDIYIVWGWIDISSEDVTYFHRVWLQNWICNIVERYNDFPDLSEQYPAQRIKRESETFPEVFLKP